MMGKYLRQLARNEIAKGELKTGPSLLLYTICDRVRDVPEDGGAQLWASERTVAQWIGRSQPTYRKWRAELIQAGLMKRLGGRPGAAARYEVFPAPSETTGVITSDVHSTDNPSEQTRKHGGAIEPHRTSVPYNEEKTPTGSSEFDDAMAHLRDAEFDFEVIG